MRVSNCKRKTCSIIWVLRVNLFLAKYFLWSPFHLLLLLPVLVIHLWEDLIRWWVNLVVLDVGWPWHLVSSPKRLVDGWHDLFFVLSLIGWRIVVILIVTVHTVIKGLWVLELRVSTRHCLLILLPDQIIITKADIFIGPGFPYLRLLVIAAIHSWFITVLVWISSLKEMTHILSLLIWAWDVLPLVLL